MVPLELGGIGGLLLVHAWCNNFSSPFLSSEMHADVASMRAVILVRHVATVVLHSTGRVDILILLCSQ